MADLWYVKVNTDGVVIRVFCDDYEKPVEGDILLDPKWYYGCAPGIRISDIGHGDKYTVQNGRLIYRYDGTAELEHAKNKRRLEIERINFSPLLSKKRKDNLPKAKQEVEDHLAGCINAEEVRHTLLIGY